MHHNPDTQDATRLEPGKGPRSWVHRVAHILDNRFCIPGTEIRFGLDPLLGLIPVVGDTITLAIGASMIADAKRLRLGHSVYARMIWNLLIDWLVGLIPLADIVLDTAVKAHTKNAELLDRCASERTNTDREIVAVYTSVTT